MSRAWRCLVGVALVAAGLAGDVGAQAVEPGDGSVGDQSPEEWPTYTEALDRVRVHVKFREASGVRLAGTRLVSEDESLSDLEAALAREPVLAVQPLFERPVAELARERARIEARTGRPARDKSLWYRLVLPQGTDPAGLLQGLNALAVVETAYREPDPAPAPATPDFTSLQGYRGPAPGGIGTGAVAGVPGGDGANVRIIDVEYSWNQRHEDLEKAGLPGALIRNKTPVDPFGKDHGTAVLGMLVGDANDFGVTGLASGSSVGMVNALNAEDGYDLADAIDLAHARLEPGDVLLIEQQTGGPACAQCYLPVEWVPAYYDAIVSATSDGIVVVEAAGNGGQDLDGYGAPFPGGRPHSGAIIVGAGNAPGCRPDYPVRGRLEFSNHGSRVDLQGWGNCVVTTGYGGLWPAKSKGPNVRYTGSFNGTSSASPVVAAAAAVLSSVAEGRGVVLSPASVRTMLALTGTPQDLSAAAVAGNIGPLPDLAAAVALMPSGA